MVLEILLDPPRGGGADALVDRECLLQVHGGFGFTDEYPVSRFYRGARYGTIGGGTSETLRDLMGKKIVGDTDFSQGILGLEFNGFLERLDAFIEAVRGPTSAPHAKIHRA